MKRLIPNLTGATALLLLITANHVSAAASYRSSDQFKIERSELRRVGQDFVESIEMLFKVDGPGALALGTTNGTVTVRTWSENVVRLVVDKRISAEDPVYARRLLDMFRVQALHGGGDLQFTGRARTGECARSVGVTFTVWVPKSYDLDIKTESGDIAIPRMEGRFKAYTSDGKISVDCDTENLDIEVEDTTESDDADSAEASPDGEAGEPSNGDDPSGTEDAGENSGSEGEPGPSRDGTGQGGDQIDSQA